MNNFVIQRWDQVGHCNVYKPLTKWDTLMCDPPIVNIIGNFSWTCIKMDKTKMLMLSFEAFMIIVDVKLSPEQLNFLC